VSIICIREHPHVYRPPNKQVSMSARPENFRRNKFQLIGTPQARQLPNSALTFGFSVHHFWTLLSAGLVQNLSELLFRAYQWASQGFGKPSAKRDNQGLSRTSPSSMAMKVINPGNAHIVLELMPAFGKYPKHAICGYLLG
jgi:hypothetical protein